MGELTKQKMPSPLVSVIMGTRYRYNSLQLLSRSMDSILQQSIGNFEFLICDDGSSSEASQLLDNYTKKDPRICLVRPGNKLTLSQKLNACIVRASGTFIARMDDDDFSHPDRLEMQIRMLSEHSDIDFAGCNVNLIHKGEICGTRRFPEYPEVKDFLMTQPFIHPALVFRRSALERAGGYSEDPHQLLCEDYDLLLRLYGMGSKGANLQDILFDYTVPNAKGNRNMRHRWNETVTRWSRFRDLGLLPEALPYVVKPILVGIVPAGILTLIKKKMRERDEWII